MRFAPLVFAIAAAACSAHRDSSSAPPSDSREAAAPRAAPRAEVGPVQVDAAVLEARAPAPEELFQSLLAALPPASQSTSIGSPTNGRLEGGVPLPLSGPGFRFNDRRSRDARYATVEVVRAIARAAYAVERELPGSELVVNDLGLAQGGAIAHHGSHRAGRDVDVLFFLLDEAERPIASVGAPLDPEGVGFDYKDLRIPEDDVRVELDAPRTFRFVRALLEDDEARVQRIFVVEHIRSLLLAEAERQGAPRELVARLADVTCQPGYPHDDHLHVRWFCSAEDIAAGCEDAAPIYPWRERELAAQGVRPVLAKKARSEEPAPVVTQEQARANVAAQEPHADVVAFLARRRSWEKQPHPRRPYCR